MAGTLTPRTLRAYRDVALTVLLTTESVAEDQRATAHASFDFALTTEFFTAATR